MRWKSVSVAIVPGSEVARPIANGWLYLAIVLDLFNCEAVG